MSFLGVGMGVGLSPGGAPGFSPHDMTGLMLWLDGKTGLTRRVDGSDSYVTHWADRSGRGINLQQTSDAQQPLLLASGGMRFDGSNDWLTTYGSKSLLRWLHLAQTTCFAMRRLQEVGAEYLYSTQGHFSSLQVGTAVRSSTTTPTTLITQVANGTAACFNPIALHQSFTAPESYVFTFAADSSGSTARLNGVADQLGVLVDPLLDADPLEQLVIGGSGAAGDCMWCEIYEVVSYDRVLAAEELAEVESYLSQRWSIAP